MIKCPYCAEEIQDEAVLCRYCNRYVRGVRFHRLCRQLITIIIVYSVIVFAFIHRGEIAYYIHNIRFFFHNLGKASEIIIDRAKDGYEVIKDYDLEKKHEELMQELERGERL